MIIREFNNIWNDFVIQNMPDLPKKAAMQERINNLEAQLDHLTQDRVKLLAKISGAQAHLNTISQIIPPTILLVQRILVNWLEDLGGFDKILCQNMENKMAAQLEKFEGMFVHYMGLIQLNHDIALSEDREKQKKQQVEFQETADYFDRTSQDMLKTLFDDVYLLNKFRY